MSSSSPNPETTLRKKENPKREMPKPQQPAMSPRRPARTQPPRRRESGNLGPAIARPLPSSTEELHGRKEQARDVEASGSWPAPPGSEPGNATADKNPTTASQEDGKGKRPAAFARVWSAADEVSILEALAAHVETHDAPPRRSELRAAVAGRLADKKDFTVTEIYEKVRRLRLSYETLHSAAGAPLPSGSDEGKLRKYELSRKVWGDAPVPAPLARRAKIEGGANAAPDTHMRRGFEDLRLLYPHLAAVVERIISAERGAIQGAVLRRAFELIDDGKASNLDAKVKRQRVLDAKMMMSRANVSNEVLSTLIRSMD